ncbi:hypothetical protein B0F90DRAFT_1184110 [Multifurca ochricompacta]|uniref:SAP domain-containing protein n=1 Tax=Multifurca ochricompacta TaxID=376703 RepID=A0AAD4QQK0_9AGAM|nr:hypothetical protein B0F90DRAFT_1184110 [Multifurca ochricompacta]
MSETTQILFNSPALHSLKRDQLVRLCKIHSIKASGKNIDLIQRLKKHALTLPLSDPSSSEQPDDDNDVQDDLASPLDLKRPSEQWEVVMEDIQELPESSSRATLSSLRSLTSNAPDEFGAGGGSKSSSMSSSLKAIANSFNFKRAASNKPDPAQAIAVSHPMRSNITDELASHSVPYSCIPEPSLVDMPHTDYFKFSTPDTTLEEHILGQLGRPGVAALANASSSGTVGPPKTTIRLVSAPAPAPPLSPGPGTPHLKPVDPAFDLVMGSPGDKGQSRVLVWPLSPQPVPSERLYPSLPVDELDQAKQSDRKFTMPSSIAPSPSPSQAVISSASKKKMYPTPSNNVQDVFSPAPKRPGVQKDVLSIPRSEPFLFGSPLPRHSVSNDAFDAAAASVLEEMNKRLSAAGVQKVDDDVFKGSTTTVATTSASTDSGGLLALGKVDRFNKVHEEQFKKMNSIATHYAAKRGAPGSKKRKSDVLGRGLAPGRKRSSADTRVISAGSRKRMGLPGGFDDEEVVDDVQEEEDRRMSKRVRLLEENGGKDKGRRLSISPGKTAAEGKQAEKERAATRKMLESRKEKRRSSRHGRTIVAGPQATRAKPRLVLGSFPQPSQLYVVCGTLAQARPQKLREQVQRQ